MVEWSVAHAARVMKGYVFGDGSRTWSGASIDSRTLHQGELFFALPGEKVDGHHFIADALKAGASAAVLSKMDEESTHASSVVLVDDPYQALHRLTRAVRAQTPRSLVAITGSAGKTTTKELLAAMLSRRYRTAKNPGNLNNLLGFPLSLLRIPESTEWMVAEMGMSTPGELGDISRLGRPDMAIFLNVKPVHLERLGNLDAVMEAKAELLEGLDPQGIVVANQGDPRVRAIAERHRGEVVKFGFGTPVSAEILSEDSSGSIVRLSVHGEVAELRWPLVGPYQVENLLAATAAAYRLGISLYEIVTTAEAFTPVPGRGVIHHQGSLTVVDETYNSNPEALAGVLKSVGSFDGKVRWAVLGAMLELGTDSEQFHREAGRLAARYFHRVIAVGQEAKPLAQGVEEEGAVAQWVSTAREAAAVLRSELGASDLVLVKGSRGVGLEWVVKSLVGGKS